jgi:tetratricopeptide (TPR) repeat protein
MFALNRLLAAFRHKSDDPFERAVAQLEKGDPAAAVAAFTDLLRTAQSEESAAQICNKRGVAHVRLGRRDEALQDFTEALRRIPRFAPALANIGNLLLEEDALDDAIAHYEAAVRADEHYPVAHLNLAVAYRKAGRRADSVRELRIAHRLEGRKLFRRR